VQQQQGGLGALKEGFGPQPGDYYEVPFRSLVTPHCPNLIVACRALSATHEASAAVRVMATMHGIGEAAGIAATEGGDVNAVSGERVRSQTSYMQQKPDFEEPWTASMGFPWSEPS